MTSHYSYEYDDLRYFRFGHNPIGKPFLFTYVYFIDGLLIDTGQSKARKEILATLSSLNVEQIFITHHHEDHSGNIEPLRQQFDCPVYAPDLCCEMMKDPPPISFAQQMVWGNRPAYPSLEPVSGSISTPNHTFTLIPIPGHARDMVALYEPEKKWLFSADLYLHSYIGYFLRDESVTQQIQSLRKALSLDFEVLFCSHNPKLTGGRQALQDKLHFLEGFYEQVIRVHRKGYNAKETFKQLKFKEHGWIKWLSHGELSKMNMVKAAIRDFEET